MARKDDGSAALGGLFLLVLLTFCLGWKGALAVVLGLVAFYLLYLSMALGAAILIGLLALVLLVGLAGFGGSREHQREIPSTQPVNQVER